MKYLLIILTTLLIGSKSTDLKKIIKEKREYDVEIQTNGTTVKKLSKTTNYSMHGQVISEIETCNDSICCPHNKPFRIHKKKIGYWYKDKRLVLRVFRNCDTLASYKDFHDYKLDNKGRLIEEIELTYNFETDGKKYEYGQWVSAKIGDSTLTETNIHQYTYTEFDSVKEEKVIIQSKYADKAEKSWIIKYSYDKDKRLVEVQHPPFENLKLSKKIQYDDKSQVVKITSNLTTETVDIDITYDKVGNVSNFKEKFLGRVISTKYEYNNKRLLTLKESESKEGSKVGLRTIKYFYNENADLIRIETSYDNKEPHVDEYEYSYY
jgi:hypothetical protein